MRAGAKIQETTPMQYHRLVKLVLMIVLILMVVPQVFTQDDEQPDQIVIERASLHPEGIEWDAENGRFLTGSFTEGTVFEIAEDGTVTPFIEDEDLILSLGIHIDRATNRLLVTNTVESEDPDVPGLAQLGIYDLNSGERLHLVDLSPLTEALHHLANDVTTDAAGNAYVTDSFAPVIYQVTPTGEASIFAENEAFASATFGLNGIEYHPDGYLLVALTEPGALFKIPLHDPEAITQVELDEAFSLDGIVLHPDGQLIVVASTVSESGDVKGEVLALESDDDWASATITNRASSDVERSPASITLRDETPYIIYSHFNELFSGQSVDAFEIERVEFAEK
jgi:sugar lactone lactonase YvrE